MALYDSAGGFFAGGGGGAGRRGDFLTSPELGPLFAAVVARALDRWWDDLGRPDPYVVVEAGAGTGTLARDVLAAAGACAPALRYVLVERSEQLRARQAGLLALEPPAAVLGAAAGDDDDEPDAHTGGRGTGPVVTSLAELPAQPFAGVVLANELLDNLPFFLLERDGSGGWQDVRVGGEAGRLVEVLVPAPPERALAAQRLAPEAAPGDRVPLQVAAQEWLRAARAVVERGRVVVIDYADTTSSLCRRPWLDWVRTYRGHGRGGHPLERPGEQDVTCEVALDQLARIHAAAADRSQAEFLAAAGLGELVAEARQRWAATAAAGGLDSVRARSRLSEAAALVDPAGLGAFRVLEWELP